MNICIVYPPHAEPEALPLGAARLAARLAKGGARVALVDANQQAWNRWLQRDHLERQLTDMRSTRDRLAGVGALHGAQAWAYHRAVRGTVGSGLLLNALTQAQAELAGPELGGRRAWAKRIIEAALDIAMWPAEGCATLNDLTLVHSTESSADVVAAARQPEQMNPFAAFWSEWLAAQTPLPDELVLWLDTDQQLIPAATLAVVLASRGSPTRLLLAGPLTGFLRQCDTPSDTPGEAPRWSALFHGVCDAPPYTGEDDAAAGYLAQLASQRRLGAPMATLSCELAGASAVRSLLSDVLVMHRGAPGLRPHLGTPLPVAELLAVADGVRAQAPGLCWSATVKFGFDLEPAAAERLRAAGCQALHFEIKGFAGYAMPWREAHEVLLRSLAAARSSGLATLGSLVYGFPSDDADSFERFISAMRRTPDAVDQWVRFRVYRLYRFSDAWRHPQRWDVAQVFEPPEGRDWCRHVDFISRHGLDSRHFHAQATRWLAEFKQREHDFPASPMGSDDAGFGRAKAAVAVALAELVAGQLIEPVPGDALQRASFDFSAMDKVYGSHVPGPGRAWPEQAFAAGGALWLARGFHADKLSAIGSGTAKLLQACQASTTAGALSAALARGGGDGDVLLRKLLKSGLVRVRGEA